MHLRPRLWFAIGISVVTVTAVAGTALQPDTPQLDHTQARLAAVEVAAAQAAPATRLGWEPDDKMINYMRGACTGLITSLGNAPYLPPLGLVDGARACQIFWDSTLDALRIAWETYDRDQPPGSRQSGEDDQRDALRHCLWQGLMTARNWNHDTWIAVTVGNYHELDALPEIGRQGHAEAQHKMDLWNNSVARVIGAPSTATDASVACWK
jgi:hypothetical protein